MKNHSFKKISFWTLLSTCALSLTVGCSSASESANNNAANSANDDTKESVALEEKKEKTPSAKALKKKAHDFPLEILDVDIVSQTDDESYKTLYPDMISTTVKNNTDIDIKSFTIAYAAWDKNNLPVKIKGNIDFSDGRYIAKVGAEDINLVPGDTYGEDSGYEIDEDMEIEKVIAVILDYTDFDGNVVKNDHADAFLDAIEGKKMK